MSCSQETVSEEMPDEINETPVMMYYKQAQLADPGNVNFSMSTIYILRMR